MLTFFVLSDIFLADRLKLVGNLVLHFAMIHFGFVFSFKINLLWRHIPSEVSLLSRISPFKPIHSGSTELHFLTLQANMTVAFSLNSSCFLYIERTLREKLYKCISHPVQFTQSNFLLSRNKFPTLPAFFQSASIPSDS